MSVVRHDYIIDICVSGLDLFQSVDFLGEFWKFGWCEIKLFFVKMNFQEIYTFDLNFNFREYFVGHIK